MNICIYCAASTAIDKSYLDAAHAVGCALAERGFGLVYGGGSYGMMGAAARGAKSACGSVIGVAPSFFEPDGVLYDNCDEFIFTATMRERKQKMEELSRAFIVLPGGIGTLDEFFEIFTLRQLGRHNKPIALLNINGYFDPLAEMLNSSAQKGFLRRESLDYAPIFSNIDSMLDYIARNVEE